MRGFEVRRAWAFAPGHVTGIFAPDLTTTDPRGRGSRGLGVVLEAGAHSEVVWQPAKRTRIQVRDERGSPLPITEEALRHLVPAGCRSGLGFRAARSSGGSGVRHERGGDARLLPRGRSPLRSPTGTRGRGRPSGRTPRGRWAGRGVRDPGRRPRISERGWHPSLGTNQPLPLPLPALGRSGRWPPTLPRSPAAAEVPRSRGSGSTGARPYPRASSRRTVSRAQRTVHRPARVWSPPRWVRSCGLCAVCGWWAAQAMFGRSFFAVAATRRHCEAGSKSSSEPGFRQSSSRPRAPVPGSPRAAAPSGSRR